MLVAAGVDPNDLRLDMYEHVDRGVALALNGFAPEHSEFAEGAVATGSAFHEPRRTQPGHEDPLHLAFVIGMTRENAWDFTRGTGHHESVNQLKIVAGDATNPQAKGPKVIAHICNDLGKWGKGFVLAISRHWPEPEREYRRWHRERARNDFSLGAVQMVRVRSDIWVANMVAQRGIKVGSGGPPIRYGAVEDCLDAVAQHALANKASVHMPRIGCGLAGGTWERIEPIVSKTLSARNIAATVYDHRG